MLFNSFPFLFGFLPVALAGYFALARRSAMAPLYWLTAVSLVFYGWWNPAFVPVLVFSVAGNYAAARLLDATGARPLIQRWTLRAAIAANVLGLVWCKYLDWLAGLVSATGLVEVTAPLVILPLGMSFFTFTQIGYLLDVRDGTASTRGFGGYAAFITFFPHLIAGPILQDREITPQLTDPSNRRFSAANLSIGLGIFCVGLSKKTLLADPMVAGVAAGFADAATLPLFAAWHTALAYSLQLYFDFSGYSDMAIGLARMFNLHFPLNFDSPYKARSVIDYWQRWHMTLTRWLTRTIYSPLSLALMRRRIARGSRVNHAAQKTPAGFATMIALPVFVTFAIAGVWHGSGVQFLVFGLLHASFLIINRVWRFLHPVSHLTGVQAIWRVLLTYASIVVASVFFRADNLGQAIALLAGMAGWHGIGPRDPATRLPGFRAR